MSRQQVTWCESWLSSEFGLRASFICDVPNPHSGQRSHPGQWAPWSIHGLWIVDLGRRRDSLTQPQRCYKSWRWISHSRRIISTLASWHLFSLPLHLPVALLASTWIQQVNIPNCSLSCLMSVSSHDSWTVGWSCREPILLGRFRHMSESWARLLSHLAAMQEKGDRSRLSMIPDLTVGVRGEEICWWAVWSWCFGDPRGHRKLQLQGSVSIVKDRELEQ